MNTAKKCLYIVLLISLLQAGDLSKMYRQRQQLEQSGITSELAVLDHRIATEYLMNGRFDMAQQFWEMSLREMQSDSLRNACRLNLARLSILKGEFSKAESALLNMYYKKDVTKLNAYRARYLLGILCALKGDYPESKNYLKQAFTLRDIWEHDAEIILDSLFVEAEKRKDPHKAMWMSGFLPGSGQIYAQNGKGAAGAFSLFLFWGGMVTYDIINQDYYSAAVVLLFPWQRYYRGNILNAKESVLQYNLRVEDKINKELLLWLSRNE